jgi:hypothetical protein
MRGLLILIVLVGAALWWGGQNFITGVREREPLEITCGDYLKNHPDNRYLRLTQCEADLDNLAIEEDKNKSIKAVYIPLRAKGVTTGPTEIVLKRTDDDITRLAGQLDKLGPGDEAAAKRILDELEAPNEGLVQFGLDLSDKDMDQLRKLNLGLSHDFIIMERGKSPRLLLGGLVLAAGLLGLAFFVRGVIRKIRGTDG